MSLTYMDFNEVKEQTGLRMTVVKGLPSPWGEAVKGILHLKAIPCSAVYLDVKNQEMTNWAGTNSAPTVVYEKEQPRSGWAEILHLMERLNPELALLPQDSKQRAQVLGLCHEICGEEGLGWNRRLAMVHAGLNGQMGFPEQIAKYLGAKYGYNAFNGERYEQRVIAILTLLAACLREQLEAGERFYMGEKLTAVDIYSATFMGMFKPLPVEHCAMVEAVRPIFESMTDKVEAALDPILIAHRDLMYSEYLALPLTL